MMLGLERVLGEGKIFLHLRLIWMVLRVLNLVIQKLDPHCLRRFASLGNFYLEFGLLFLIVCKSFRMVFVVPFLGSMM